MQIEEFVNPKKVSTMSKLGSTLTHRAFGNRIHIRVMKGLMKRFERL